MITKTTSQRLLAILRALGGAAIAGAGWLGDRVDDLGHWAANLIRYLPARVSRIVLTVGVAIVSIITFLPLAFSAWRHGGQSHFEVWLRARARSGALRAIRFVLQALDLLGMPELFTLLWRIATHVSPLTGAEIDAAASVMGPAALRFHDIRIARGGILGPIFKANKGRAFTTFHMINMPSEGPHRRSNLEILVHELVHVYQYERAGSRYFVEALLAQRTDGYDYGGAERLQEMWAQGRRLRDFNREQQAQLVQDYYVCRRQGQDISAFEPYIAELRAGKI